MAIDKLVDSTQLDTDLTSVANAIRTKGGTSAQLAFPADFVTAIGDIPSGDASFSFSPEYVRLLHLRATENGQECVVDYTKFPNLENIESAFYDHGFKKITITPPTAKIYTGNMFHINTSSRKTWCKEINFLGAFHVYGRTSVSGLFGNNTGLVTINGVIDLSTYNSSDGNGYKNNASSNMFYSCSSLQNVTFSPGSMTRTTIDWNLSWCAALSDDSLISIANALKDTYSGTITFHATPKARLSTIMGTVTVTDGLSTFTKSESGTVTLENFLTVTKGATLA